MGRVAEARPGGGHWFGEHALFVRYLISHHENDRLSLLTLPALDGGRALPVFRTERAARSFLCPESLGHGWQVRESTAGEMVSLLMGYAADVKQILLDPDPDGASEERVGREDFISTLMGEPLVLPPR